MLPRRAIGCAPPSGSRRHLVATSETGVVHYAQLSFGDAMLMLAQVRDTALDQYMKQPDEIGGAETQGCYFRVSDVDAHYARSKAAGADIVLDIQDDAFGGRSYACRDPEGHIWNFGTYDPWQGKRPGQSYAQSDRGDLLGMRWRAVIVGLLATIVASVVVAAGMYGALKPGERFLEAAVKEAEQRAARAAQASLKTKSSAREAAEHVAREALEQFGPRAHCQGNGRALRRVGGQTYGGGAHSSEERRRGSHSRGAPRVRSSARDAGTQSPGE